jgi:trk system potassium uptake protein TrkH
VIALTTLIIGAMGRRLSLRSEVIASPSVDITGRLDAGALVVATVKYTLAIEAAGAALLWALWLPRLGAAGAIWPAVFHAVSAFCNAGFSTFSANLAGDRGNPAVLAVVGALIVIGGFGYLSVEELLRWWRERGRVRRRISTHTFAALWVTALLLVAGTALFAIFEWDGVLRGLGVVDKLANAAFMAVVPRTAGFNAVSYADVGNRTGFLTVLLMIVGGSPGSTAGGIKTTALAVLVALAVARIRGRRHVALHGRTVPEGTIQRTVSLSLLAFTLLAAALLVLATTETRGATAEGRALFLPLLFEAASAFGTVGLSMDLTPALSPAGKLVLVLLMFVGRVGPLPFFAALALPPRAASREIRAAHEDLIVG